MFSLEIGGADLLFIGLVGIGFAGIVIAVVVFTLRRARAMSDELSKEAKVKFDAIKPSLPLQTAPQLAASERPMTVQRRESPEVRPSSSTVRVVPNIDLAGYSALKMELQDMKNRLQHYARDASTFRIRDAEMKNEIEALKNEVQTLRERLVADGQGIQKLRTTLAEQNVRLENQMRDIELQRKELKAATEPAERTLLVQQQPPVTQPIPQSASSNMYRAISNFFHRRICTGCGRQLRSQDRFCDSCGRPVTQTQAQGVVSSNRTSASAYPKA